MLTKEKKTFFNELIFVFSYEKITIMSRFIKKTKDEDTK